MNLQHYSIESLESVLSGILDESETALLYEHLETCDECNTTMDELVNKLQIFKDAKTIFSPDELDRDNPAHDELSEIDFTVEHLEPSDEPNVLGRLGGYDVLEIIGRGGMGIVLKAYDRELKRCVAIKVLAPHLAQSSLAKKRFAREAQAAAAVVHPNVLAIHQVSPNGRLPFLVMPLVAGESLAHRLTAQGTLELKEVLRIGMQAAAGLAAAHEQGLVHRDVKPANILLEKGIERVVLTDFGLARAADDATMTRWGVIAGTPQYMSPEQAQGESVDCRSDLFSLGCVLYEISTGTSPFRADSTMATLRRLIDDEPQALGSLNPELPPWFIGIVDRLLMKDPSKRFNSAKELSELLEACLAHLQQPASVSLPEGLSKPVSSSFSNWRNNRLLKYFALTGGFLIALCGIFLVSSTTPADISGQWSSEKDWGKIVLIQTKPGEFIGTYTNVRNKENELGKIELKWSRLERRFIGTWRENENRSGELSLRAVDDEIRGEWDTKPTNNNATAYKATNLTWVREYSSANAKTMAVYTNDSFNLKMPHGGKLSLVAIGGFGKNSGTWWSPDGTPIKGDNGFKGLDSRQNLTNPIVFEILYSDDASNPSGPSASSKKARFESYLSLSQTVNGITPPIVVGCGAGPWKYRATLAIGQKFKDGELECEVTESTAVLPHTQLVKYTLSQPQDLEAVVVAVDKNGAVEELFRSYGLKTPDNRGKTLTPSRHSKHITTRSFEIDHYELMTRPRHWASFTGFALSANQTIDRSKLVAKNLSLAEVERVTTGVEQTEENISAESPKVRMISKKVDDQIFAWEPNGKLITNIDNIYFLSRAQDANSKPGEIRVWTREPLWDSSNIKLGLRVTASKENTKLLYDQTSRAANSEKWQVFVMKPKEGASIPSRAEMSFSFDPGDGRWTISKAEKVATDFTPSGNAPVRTISAEEAQTLLHEAKQTRDQLIKQFERKPLPHNVKFELGATFFEADDSIKIEEVTGTAETIKPGNMYEIKGTYRLSSREKAGLAVYVTEDGSDPNAIAFRNVSDLSMNGSYQMIYVDKGTGKFKLRHYVWSKGFPHVSFYEVGSFASVYYGTGESVLKKGWWENEKSPKLDPEQAEKLSADGWKLWTAGKFGESLNLFEKATKLNPKSSAAWNGLGWSALNNGDFKNAKEAFNTLLKLEPKHVAALNGLGQMALGEKNYEAAEKYLLTAAEQNEMGAVAPLYGLAKLYLAQEKFAEAEKWAQKIVDAEGESNAGMELLNQAKAKKQNKVGVPSVIVPPRELVKAWALLNQGNRVESKKLFDELFKNSPDNVDVLNGMGWYHLFANESKKAKPYFEKAVKLDPSAAGSLNGLARIFKEEGKIDDAVKLWEEMLKNSPVGVNAGTIALAEIYYERRDFKKALPLLEQIAKEQPDNKQVQSKLQKAKEAIKLNDHPQTTATQFMQAIKDGDTVAALKFVIPEHRKRFEKDLDRIKKELLIAYADDLDQLIKFQGALQLGDWATFEVLRPKTSNIQKVNQTTGLILKKINEDWRIVYVDKVEFNSSMEFLRAQRKRLTRQFGWYAKNHSIEPTHESDLWKIDDTTPRILDVMPDRGATDIDPNLTEITVTFDRDMEKGMSWTGNEQTFLPPIDKDRKARWIGKRTCVLPVKLEKGSYYRVGINSIDFQNFKSIGGKPANPDVIYFTTEGASEEIKSRCRVPKVLKFEPDNLATDIDPDCTEVRVTFDMEMSDGMSWCTNGDDQSPKAPFEPAFWSKDHRAAIESAELHPEQWYRVTLNSPLHIGFQSKWGVPLEPVIYKFRTAKETMKIHHQ